jgi:aminoglycoside 3-N-acetyltransferase
MDIEKSLLREQMYALGIKPGNVVMMHSSMKALGLKILPEEFLDELMEALTDEGTLLLPALTYEGVTPERPFFSVTESIPNVGLLPKTFLHMDGVKRSLHPTHSVCAWGAKAEKLTRNHALDDTPVGPHSPFMLLPEVGGKMLFVGDILHSCTFMHGIEEIVNAPYAMNKGQTLYMMKDDSGLIHEKYYYTHNFKGWEQEYGRIRDILTYPDIREGQIGYAPCTLIEASALKTAAIESFREDIYAFVSPAGPQSGISQ